MSEHQIPLQVFGPQALCCWLFHHWEGLEDGSKGALRLLHAQVTQSSTIDEERLIKLATSFEYERALAALTDGDFERFVDWALDFREGELGLEGWKRPDIPVSLSDLDVGPQELRELLLLTFSRDCIWPRHGPRILLQEALDAANKAREALELANSNIVIPQRVQAVWQIHSGLDRALLGAEGILNLLVEFLALASLRVQIATEDEVKKLLEETGLIPGDGNKFLGWYDKELIVGIHRTEDKSSKRIKSIRNKLLGVQFRSEEDELAPPVEEWWPIWDEFQRLLHSCSLEIREIESDQGRRYEVLVTGKMMRCLNSLRDFRNRIRHSSSERKTSLVPKAYIGTVPKLCEKLQELSSLCSESSVPEIAKIISCSSDCYGGSALTLALETQRMVVARYVHISDKEKLAGQAEKGLAMTQREYEFFVFPSPGPEQHLLINPLLLRRDYTYRELGSVGIRATTIEEEKAIREIAEKAPVEEMVGEV